MRGAPHVSWRTTYNRRGCLLTYFRRAIRNHGLNIVRHGAKIDRQFFEKFAFVEVGGQPADQVAILGFDQQLFKLGAQVFHF
jgi:hypothetical protein